MHKKVKKGNYTLTISQNSIPIKVTVSMHLYLNYTSPESYFFSEEICIYFS